MNGVNWVTKWPLVWRPRRAAGLTRRRTSRLSDSKSATGLGRVKTALAMSRLAGGPSSVSGHDRGDQRLDPDDVHYPGQIIGENREGHLGGYFWKRFCEEVRRPHAGFHRAERMFDCLAPLPHGQGIVVEAPLHFFQHVLMLPARNPPLLAGCAASFECTVAARIGPIAPQLLAVLLVGVVVDQLFASRTAIRILVAEIDKVLFAKATPCLKT